MRTSGWLVIGLVIVLFLFTLGGAVVAYSGVRQLAIQAGEVAELPPFDPFSLLQPTRTPLPTTAPSTPVSAVDALTPVVAAEVTPAGAGDVPAVAAAPTEAAPEASDFAYDVYTDPNRVTILLLGIDQRQGEEGPFRTDTMMVVSLDPVRRSAVMLSIPRDLWVDLPGNLLPQRINTANAVGDSMEFPGGGPAMAALTVEQNLGIPIDHTIRVNFDLFLAAVNAIAPVEVCIEDEIHDDHYPDGSYGIMIVHFDPGCQPLDAEQLLQFARTRATQGGDFDRAARQQQTIRALQSRVLSLGGMQAIISQVPALWEAVRENIQTTLSLEELVSLGALALEIPQENIRQAVLDENYVRFRTTEANEQVLMLQPNAALRLVQELFNPTEMDDQDLANLAAAETYNLSVVNGTGIAGLARDMAAWLEAQGYTISHVGNAANPDYRTSLIKDRDNQNPYSTRLLADLLGLPTTAIQPGLDMPQPNIDVQIVVGLDMVELVQGSAASE